MLKRFILEHKFLVLVTTLTTLLLISTITLWLIYNHANSSSSNTIHEEETVEDTVETQEISEDVAKIDKSLTKEEIYDTKEEIAKQEFLEDMYGIENSEETGYSLYYYDDKDYESPFSVKFPSYIPVKYWEEFGDPDVEYTIEGETLSFDFSASEKKGFEDLLEGQVNKWGTYDYTYNFEVIESGYFLNGKTVVEDTTNSSEYKIFKIDIEETQSTYTIGFIEISQIRNGPGYLEIQTSADEITSNFRELFNNIQYL